ncbi:helix-turn-helix domain-containing protein [Myceligenerans salitolerans]|uniref:Helix-turn-helix transcriptional regulator n=1 Tax=Myceligenerans salitolerans TaxID=1230528 RepID=A0ABS3ICK8_9MICO|nr:helix-turn-helix transcriptional regulator [Myceligenerans salitolerans]MBO0610704.1 helix-turn-helix transcriptional regulator [Myceligenerans salitolerans]
MSRRSRLSDARKSAGYSQEALAEQLGIDRTTVQRWESGESRPQPLQRANLATALGLTRDALEAALGTVATGLQVSSATPSPLEAARPTFSTSPTDPGGLLGLLDAARPLVDDTLAATTLSPGRLDLIEERVAEHLVMYTRTAPAVMLSVLASDIVEVRGVAAIRQPAMVQVRLSETLAVLALLAADALMKLGEIRRSRYWYGTARLASDDTGNLQLQARVRAQEAMLPYYYGQVEQAVELARGAQALLPGVASEPTALAAAAEGRALAKLGDARGAEHAMDTAQRYVDQADSLGSPDAAFQFNHKRLLMYLSGTLSYLDEPARAGRVQEEALALYNADPDLVIDPALIKLDQAVILASQGRVDESCQLAVQVVTTLPAEHRTRVVLTKTQDVVHALPEGCRERTRAAELGELVATQMEGSR